MGTSVSGLATLVSQSLADSLRRYRAFIRLIFPALLALVVPLQVSLASVGVGVLAPSERLPAALFALQVTVLSLLVSYSFLPRAAAAALEKRPSWRGTVVGPGRRALIAASLVALGLSLRGGPGRYGLPAVALASLFAAAWPWVRLQAALGSRLVHRGMRLWRRSSPSRRLTVGCAFVLAQAAPLVLGRAASLVAGSLGGPPVGWMSQVLLAAGLLPLHLLILIHLGHRLEAGRA